ncbi:MAG TPA: prolipoprotein diacylglyceryl transferase family protein [Planctomycetota bacterium]|nr:prolipoprotein diacylglyceryl transferase family protein [Planctomycetota bacterium]
MYPELFRLPFGAHGIPITSYGAMLVLAFFVTTWMGMWIGPKLGFKAIDISDYVFIAMISGLVGARLLIGFEEPTPMFYPHWVGGGPPSAGDIMPPQIKLSNQTGPFKALYTQKFTTQEPNEPPITPDLDYIGMNRINYLLPYLAELRAGMEKNVDAVSGTPALHTSFLQKLREYDTEIERLNQVKAWYVANKSQYLQPFEVLKIWQGGLTFYGGAIAGVLMSILFTRWRKIPLREFWDFAAPYLALGLAIGRIGCYLNGCCQGAYTDLFGVHFPAGADAIEDYTQKYFKLSCDQVPLHPAQLYSTLGDLVLAGYLFALYPYRKYPGQVSVHCMAMYIPMRICLELIRTEPNLGAGLTPSMWVGVIMIPLPIWWYFRWSKTFANHPGAQIDGTVPA